MLIEVALILFLLFLYYAIKDGKPSGMPPGPIEFPIIGQFSPVFEEVKAEELRKKYGNIVTGRLGSMRTVIIYDYKMAKDAMAKLEFAGRPSFFADFNLDEDKTGGLVGSNGAQWQHDRRFTLKNLRNLGMGKSYLETAINVEAQALVDDLAQYGSNPVEYPNSFRAAPLNIIWQMVASTRYDVNSKEVGKICDLTNDFRKLSSPWMFLEMFFPTLKRLPSWLRRWAFRKDVFEAFIENMRTIVKETLTEHEKSLDPDSPRDLIDEYLIEMAAEEAKGGDKELLFRRGALMQIINDLFSAGSDTVNNMIKWVVFLLARYPAIASRMQAEIDQHVAREKLVSLDDKPSLPYVEAFTTEALRYSSMFIMNVQRSALVDTNFEGYVIPKDTVITVCNYSVHFDPTYWNDPEQFLPERFINDAGEYKAPREGFFAFGSGRRQCLGELLARMELFLFTAAIVQNFDILVPEATVLEDKFGDILGVRSPRDYKLIYKPRSPTKTAQFSPKSE